MEEDSAFDQSELKLVDTTFTLVVLCPIGVDMDTVRVLISERRAQSGELIMSIF